VFLTVHMVTGIFLQNNDENNMDSPSPTIF